jgi:hypothetical protein
MNKSRWFSNSRFGAMELQKGFRQKKRLPAGEALSLNHQSPENRQVA